MVTVAPEFQTIIGTADDVSFRDNLYINRAYLCSCRYKLETFCTHHRTYRSVQCGYSFLTNCTTTVPLYTFVGKDFFNFFLHAVKFSGFTHMLSFNIREAPTFNLYLSQKANYGKSITASIYLY